MEEHRRSGQEGESTVIEAITEALAESHKVFLLARSVGMNSALAQLRQSSQLEIEEIAHCPSLCELVALWQHLDTVSRRALLFAARALV